MFVTLEGIDRSGKTTQAAMLAEALGPRALLVREPGGTPAGERIRELLKDPEIELNPTAELLLFSAARAQLAEDVLAPARDAGRDVVCDRFVDSTVAYQGVARGLGVELVEQLTTLVVGEFLPDLTILLRVDPARAFDREAGGDDRFESGGIEFQHRVAAAYEELARRHAERIVAVDAAGPKDAVHAAILEHVRDRR